jgi:hypothetical protein
MHIATTVPCRTRLYTTTANQTADAGRTTAQDPVEGSGVLLDYITTSTFLGGDLAPEVDGSSMAAPPVTQIPITIDLGATGPTTVTFTYVQTET